MTAIMTIDPGQALGDALASPQVELSFNSIVSRQLVHRMALAEVLLTDWCPTGDRTYLCAAQWPRGHSLYRVLNGHHDTMLIAETLRQTGILLAHSAEGVPLDWKFVMDRMAISAHSGGLRAGLAPADIVVEAEMVDLRRRTPSAVHMRLDTRFRHDGRPFGTASVWMRCVAPAVYRRLRGERTLTAADSTTAPLPADPHAVGMSTEADVVLGAPLGVGVWPLRVRTDHPVLFDHPQDHVPGMLVFEGFRQAGRALLGWPDAQLTGCDITFTRYLELDRPSIVTVTTAPQATSTDAALTVTVTQDGQTAVSGIIEIRRTRQCIALAA
ncbi:MAG TPA: ScbA/BarX family gamma-butyrolactone biosynthesis protein [Pseudonocardiaceae bacterium]